MLGCGENVLAATRALLFPVRLVTSRRSAGLGLRCVRDWLGRMRGA